MLRDIIQKLAQQENVFNTILGTVTEVSEADRVCSVQPIDGSADILDVRLSPILETDETDIGEYNIPAVGSIVFVTLLDKDNAFVSGFSVITKKVGTLGKLNYMMQSEGTEKVNINYDNKCTFKIDQNGRLDVISDNIVFNNGSLGGMVKHNDLQNYLNEVKNFLESVKIWLNGHVHPAATPNTAVPLLPFNGIPPVVPNMQNNKIAQ